jgi:hypothetical protein
VLLPEKRKRNDRQIELADVFTDGKMIPLLNTGENFYVQSTIRKLIVEPSIVVHTCNSSTQVAEAGELQDQEGQSSGLHGKTLLPKKKSLW